MGGGREFYLLLTEAYFIIFHILRGKGDRLVVKITYFAHTGLFNY